MKILSDVTIDGYLEVAGEAFLNLQEIEPLSVLVTQSPSVTVGLETRSSVSGADAVVNITHFSDTEASGARLSLGVQGANSGDPVIGLRAGEVFWTMGLDNSDGDAWKLTNLNYLGDTGEAIKVTTAGAVTILGALAAGSFSSGTLNLTGGHSLVGSGGSLDLTGATDANVSVHALGTGNVELLSAGGAIAAKSNLTLTTGKKILDSAGTQVEFGDNIYLGTNKKVTGSAEPTAPGDLATKSYVDTPRIGAATATGSSVTVDVAGKDTFRLTMQASVTALTLTGAADGQRVNLEVIQDATGSRTLAWPSNVRFGTDLTAAVLTTAASKKDRVGLVYDSAAGKYDLVAFVKGF